MPQHPPLLEPAISDKYNIKEALVYISISKDKINTKISYP